MSEIPYVLNLSDSEPVSQPTLGEGSVGPIPFARRTGREGLTEGNCPPGENEQTYEADKPE